MKAKNKTVVFPLTDLKSGQKGEIAGIHTKNHEKLKKMMAMGILPGIKIGLIQTFPSYVFQVGQSQFATDKEIAECILVKITADHR